MRKNLNNILIVSHHYPPHITGVGIIAYNQAKCLLKRGYNVTVVTSSTAPDETSGIFDGIRVERIKALNFTEKFHAPFPIFYPSLIYKLYKETKLADVVHIHDSFYISSFFSAVIAKLLNKPIVLTQHVSIVNHPSSSIVFLQKLVYATTGLFIKKISNKIFTYNSRVEQFLLKSGVKKEKIITVVNGVNVDFFKPVTLDKKNILKNELGLDVNKKTVLFVGRFVPKKGFDKVLKLRNDTYQVVFAGGESNIQSDNQVKFLGKLNQRDILKVYQAADIFVLPSESEGFPVSIQEAMATGLPIITSNDPGYSSYKFDTDNFILLSDSEFITLKKTVKDLVLNDEKIKSMSEYSIKYASANFNWDKSVDVVESVYLDLVKKNKIAFVSDAIYEFNKGGKEKRLYDLSIKLVESGYDVTIYCMKWWEGDNVFIKDGIKYHAISKYYSLYNGKKRSIKQAVLFSLSCFKLINKEFDVLDVDHIPHLVIFPAKIISIIRNKKLIVTWHEVWGLNYWVKYTGKVVGLLAYFIEKITSKLPDEIISVSDKTTYDLVNVLKVNSLIHTIPNGIDFHKIQNTTTGVEESDIIFVGRLLSNKNVSILIDSINYLKNKGLKLKVLIVGVGPEMIGLKEKVVELGMESQIIFKGFVEKSEDVYGLIKSSKIFVLPSDREGFGIVVIEANACGIPVITVDVLNNAAKDLIIDNKNGLISRLDPVDIADKIKIQLADLKAHSYYSDFSKKYDWNVLMPQIMNIYK